ncbi:unnamed protein product, partial [Candidula unifasciata]
MFSSRTITLILATSDAFVSLRFLTFWNPRGRGSNGHCCDGKFFFCGSQCDHSFTICLDRADGVADSVSYCSYGKTVSREIANANHITFGDRIGVIANPVVFRINSWPGRARLKIHVVDVDEHTFDDDVDFLQTVMTLSPVDGRSRVHFTLKNRVQLAIDAQIYCGHHYYGSSCSQYCAPRDDFVGHYTCDPQYGTKICLTGYTGDTCSVNVDDCLPSPCHNGAICHDLVDDFLCSCPDGFTGKLCDEDINECQLSPCKNNGTCVNTDGGHHCDCLLGFHGNDCSLDVDECNQYPCKNDGVCTNVHGGYIKIYFCSTGYNCEHNINECLEEICKNGGTCTDLEGHFECTCTEFWEGKT